MLYKKYIVKVILFILCIDSDVLFCVYIEYLCCFYRLKLIVVYCWFLFIFYIYCSKEVNVNLNI